LLTEKEEKIIKLMTAKVIAQTKLNKVNLGMGNAIRAEFKSIDERIRKETENLYLPLEAEIKSIDNQIKIECE